MKVTYSWLIYSCLSLGSGILCDRKDDDSCSINDEDKFYCSNGLCIKSSWVCDGHKDCSDGSDENKELCALYGYAPNMPMNCGRVNIKNQVTLKKYIANIGTAPWNVGIYRLNKENSNYELICGGSIISPNLVVSVAHCFWQEGMLSKKISINDGLYKISVGKYERNFTVIGNDFTQIINVSMIHLKRGYNGPTRFHAEDIAIIVLQDRVSFSNGVSPVCVDWNGEYNIVNGDEGKMVSWGNMGKNISNPDLFEISLTYIDHETCQKMYRNRFETFVTADKFCAGSKLGQGVGRSGSGAGLTFLHSNSYYLTGLVSVSDPNNSITVFTDIKYHIHWIRGFFEVHVGQGKVNVCVLPTVKGVVYSYEGSNDILSHGTLISHHRTVIENCEVGYHKAYPISVRVCLEKGKWFSFKDILCLEMCPPLKSDSLDIKCSHNGEYANCSNSLIPNTTATISCKPTYTAPNGQDENPLELLCQSNGTWNKQLYRCNPYCGRVYIKNQILINNGYEANIGTAPWNVGIYQLIERNRNHELVCGGSIISPNLVVSVAHSFWKKGTLSKNISIKDGLYKIAVGKYTRDFKVIDNDFTKIINVEMIHLNDDYYGPSGYHAADIAIIVLKDRVSFSNGVAPVCIDWNGKYNIANGDRGKIVGWGITEENIPSPVLLEESLSYIDRSSCRDMYTNGFENFITVDKFCAGSALGNKISKH
ncbi:unnamed protein product [Macrosiphum euphorbiae]|uniref:Uncharacterized protein n=1 Tax=Macrosiphum euphorbiae TaxID=13131 RepID=A0AAV0VKR6_9HEMI|nr:unnamed protein product [Macrosiphum euphorbiae]